MAEARSGAVRKGPLGKVGPRRGKARRSTIACLTCRLRKVRCDVMTGAPCANCRIDKCDCIIKKGIRNRKKFESLPAILVASSHIQDGDVKDSTSTGQPAWQRTSSGSDQRKPSWQHLPRFIEPLSAKTLSTGHLEFLETQNAFELPSWSLQKALIEAYVEYAYPYMPLIQLPDFLDSLENLPLREGKKHSLLLYLALLFAGAAFVSQSALKADTMGFSTRKLARRELSKRVTLLYDLGFEKDRLVLTQTALLMSSWSDVPHDQKDSWHWMGLAISNALASGLNHPSSDHSLTPSERKLRKRIWWSCYMRDRFLAIGLRRPMRIRDTDASVAPLETSDFEVATLCRPNEIISSEHSVLYRLEKQLELAEICVHRSRLSSLIEGVMATQDAYDQLNRASKTSDIVLATSNADDMFAYSAACLLLWNSALPLSCEYRATREARVTPALALHQGHLQMTFHTLLYSLHRPRALPISPDRSLPSSMLFTSTSGQALLSSAIAITSIVADLRDLELDSYLPISGVTIISPAMVVSLLVMKTEDQASRRQAAIRFATCMKVMESMRETYVAADETIKYFKAAMAKAGFSPATSSHGGFGQVATHMDADTKSNAQSSSFRDFQRDLSIATNDVRNNAISFDTWSDFDMPLASNLEATDLITTTDTHEQSTYLDEAEALMNDSLLEEDLDIFDLEGLTWDDLTYDENKAGSSETEKDCSTVML